jgi:Uma2 family endonuclease
MSAPAPALLTYDQYLQLERETDIRHEWRRGVAVAMAGGTLTHAELSTRVLIALGIRLQGKPCQPWNSDAKVRIAAEDVSTYPDISVVCGEVIRDTLDPQTITNPTVLIEVLSESTENYDRDEKFNYYKALPSLREYVLVSQFAVKVNHYALRKDGSWLYRDLGTGDVLRLRSVGVRLPIDEIYAGVPLETRKVRLGPRTAP